MDPKPKRQPVPASGQPTPDTIAAADATPPVETPANDAGADQTDNVDPEVDGELIEARVLVAFDEHDANDIFVAPADEVERQKIAGNVDPHPDAVAYAKSLVEGA